MCRIRSTRPSTAVRSAAAPPFTDEHIEFVPACDVFRLALRDNSLSRCERYARLLVSRGVAETRRRLSEMLAIDHVIGNFDRHWGNFGVLVDAETREWVVAAAALVSWHIVSCGETAAAYSSTLYSA